MALLRPPELEVRYFRSFVAPQFFCWRFSPWETCVDPVIDNLIERKLMQACMLVHASYEANTVERVEQSNQLFQVPQYGSGYDDHNAYLIF